MFMVLRSLKRVVMFIPNKLTTINSDINQIISFPEKVDKTFTYFTKVTGVTTGAAAVAKGSVGLTKVITCSDGDGVCAVVLAIGIIADGLQICTSFILGPNLTNIVTIPISVGCKMFIWYCKRSKLPWGGC